MNDNPELKPERAHRSKTNDRGLYQKRIALFRAILFVFVGFI